MMSIQERANTNIIDTQIDQSTQGQSNMACILMLETMGKRMNKQIKCRDPHVSERLSVCLPDQCVSKTDF